MTPSPDYDVMARLSKEVGRLNEEAILDDRASDNSLNPDASPVFAEWARMKRERASDILALIAKARAGEAAVEALERIATVDYGGGFLGAEACRKVARTALSRIREGEQS